MEDQGRHGDTTVPSGPPLERYQPSGRKFTKKELTDRLAYAEAKDWSVAHKRQISPLPLPDAAERRIRQWFELADDSGDGQLNKAELEFALRASGIPADSEAIMEIINLFDYDRDGEIAWREFHNYFAHEVMAGRDPLGSEYVLPSGTALPLGSMIGAIRRRRIINDVEKGGKARGFWSAEGPEFLRYLLESEHYTLDQPGGSRTREVVMRILAYKPPPSKEADPAAVEEHRRRIERLKMILMRTASGRPLTGEMGGDGPAAGAGAGGGTNAAKRAASTRRVGGFGGGGFGGGGAAVEDSTARLPPPAAATTLAGDVSAVAETPGRKVARPPLRFASALAATQASAAVAEAEVESKRSQAANGSGGGETPRGGGGGSRAAAAGGSGGDVEVEEGAADALKAALQCAGQMQRLEEALEHHRQRTGTTRPRPAAGNISLASSRAGNPRYPVVLPVQVAAADLLTAPAATPRRQLTCDGGGGAGLATSGSGGTEGPDGGVCGEGSARATPPAEAPVAAPEAGRRPTQPDGQLDGCLGNSNSGAHCSGGDMEWVASAEGIAGAGRNGGDVAAAAGAGLRPRPPPLRGVGDEVAVTGDAGGDGDAWAGWAARSAGPDQSRPPSCRSLQSGLSGQSLTSGQGSGSSRPQSGASGAADGGAMAATEGAAAGAATSGPGQTARGESAGWVSALTGSAAASPRPDPAAPWSRSATADGSAPAAATGAAPAAAMLSSPQPSIPRLSSHLLHRSLSTGRGPYTAQLVRTGRVSGRNHGLPSPRSQQRGPGAGDASTGVSINGGLDADRSSQRFAMLGVAAGSPPPTTAGEVGQPGGTLSGSGGSGSVYLRLGPSLDGGSSSLGPRGGQVWTAGAASSSRSSAFSAPCDPSGLSFAESRGTGGAAAAFVATRGGGGSSSASAAAAAAAFAAATLRPTVTTPAAQAPLPSPPHSSRFPNGRVDAAAAAAEIRRVAWTSGSHGHPPSPPPQPPSPRYAAQQHSQHSQHGGRPQAPTCPSSSALTSPATSARPSLSGNTSGSFTAGGAARRLVPTNSRAAAVAAAGVAPFRRSVDLGECSLERVTSSLRAAGAAGAATATGFTTVNSPAAANAPAAATAAAAAAWLGAAKAAESPSGSSSGFAGGPWTTAAPVTAAPEGLRQQPFVKPQIQIHTHIPSHTQDQAHNGSVYSPTQVPHTPPGLADFGLYTPTDWQALASPSPSSTAQPTRGSGNPLQPTISRNAQPPTVPPTPRSPLPGATSASAAAAIFAVAKGAAAAAGSGPPAGTGRRSFELEPRPGGWRSTAGRSPSSVASCTQPGGAVRDAGGPGGWARGGGRLMKTCLASALRTTQPTAAAAAAASPPAPTSPGSYSPAAAADSPSPVAGTGGSLSDPYTQDAGTAGHQRATGRCGGEVAAAATGDGGRRKAVFGGLLFSGAVTAKPGPELLPDGVHGSGKATALAAMEPAPELRFPPPPPPAAFPSPIPSMAIKEGKGQAKSREGDGEDEAGVPEPVQPMRVVGVGRESPTPWLASASGAAAAAARSPWPWQASAAKDGREAAASGAVAAAAVVVAQGHSSTPGGVAGSLQVRPSTLRPW